MKHLWKIGLAAVALLILTVIASTAMAEDQPKLTAVSVQMTASDTGVVYHSYANRYIVGPNGWIEWKITVKEKVAGFTEGGLYNRSAGERGCRVLA